MASNDLSFNVGDHDTAVEHEEKKRVIKCNHRGKVVEYDLLEKRRSKEVKSHSDEDDDDGDDTDQASRRRRAQGLKWSKHCKKYIARFVYEAGIEFHTIRKGSFQGMLNAIRGFRQSAHAFIPSREELKGWLLRDAVEEMQQYVGHIRKSWESTGCSILLDGWEDECRNLMINVLVDSPEGTVYLRSADIPNYFINDDANNISSDALLRVFLEEVVADVGIENVVQIIASSALARMTAIGKQLTDKYRSFFWTVCSSHCVQLMLQKLAGMDVVKEIMEKAKTISRFFHSQAAALKLLRDETGLLQLVTPSNIKFSTPFLTLEHMVLSKDNLQMFFLSPAWESSYLASTHQGSRVADLVADCSFWTGATTALKATIPLVRALDLINNNRSDHESQLVGYIYETIDQAKETICEEFNHEKSLYMPFWEAVDEIWNQILHSHLHSAAYFFNPTLFYLNDSYTDREIKCGIHECALRMAPDLHTYTVILEQISQYHNGQGAFGDGKRNVQPYVSPVVWWMQYGKDYPELQRVAIRILSQTCNGGSKYKLKRSTAEKLLSKGRNPVEQRRLTDLLFVHYNLHLQYFESGVGDDEADHFLIYGIEPWEDWKFDRSAQAVVSQNGEPTWVDCDCGGVNATDAGDHSGHFSDPEI